MWTFGSLSGAHNLRCTEGAITCLDGPILEGKEKSPLRVE